MSGSVLLWILLALAIFWGVGVYNRLMRMRARGLAALGSVEKHMKQYGELVSAHLAVPGVATAPVAEHLPPEWAQMLTLLHTLDHALKDAKSTPLSPEPLAFVSEAFDAVQNAWLNLREVPADLVGPAVPAAMQLQWDAATVKVQTARGGLNQILTKYNEAIVQFPARLIVGILGFKPTGLL